MKSKKNKKDHKVNEKTLEKAKELNLLEKEYLDIEYEHLNSPNRFTNGLCDYASKILIMEEKAKKRTELYNSANFFLKSYCAEDMMLCKLYLRLAQMLTEEKYEIAEMLKHNIISWETDKKFDQKSIKKYVNTL